MIYLYIGTIAYGDDDILLTPSSTAMPTGDEITQLLGMVQLLGMK